MNDWRPGPSAEQLQTIERLSPEAVRTYLTAEGWLPRHTSREDLWTLVEGSDEFEVLVPTDRRLRDFPLRMYDLIRTLATVQDRPLPAVLADLTNIGADRMTFRLLPAGRSGTIPLFHGVEAVRGVQELILAATYASTAERLEPVQGRRSPQVRDFAREFRLGTPQAGSWAISAEVDIPDPGAEGDEDVRETDAHTDGGEPFARRVSLQLHGGVRAAFLAAGEAVREDSADPFLRRVQDGVSANLCEALASVGRDDTPFEVRFAWAQRLPPPPIDTGSLHFDQQRIRTIRSAGKTLRTALPDGPAEIIGIVTELHRGRQGTGRASVSGRVRIRGEREVDQRVTVLLTPAQHERAIRMYEEQQYIRVVGEVRQGRVDIVRQLEVVDPGNSPSGDW